MSRRIWLGPLFLGVVAVAGITWISCQSLGREAVKVFTPSYSAPRTPDGGAARSLSDSQRDQVKIDLREVAGDFQQPTDVHFVPTEQRVLVVLEKEGAAYAVNLDGRARNKVITLDVTTTDARSPEATSTSATRCRRSRAITSSPTSSPAASGPSLCRTRSLRRRPW